MRVRTVVVLLTLVGTLALAEGRAAAQAMPDAAQMSGVPLPAGELPNGTVTVRL